MFGSRTTQVCPRRLVLNSRPMSCKEFKPGQRIRIKLSGGRIEDATIKAVIERTDGVRLQVDFGHDETALIELWQVVNK
jgi:hypothetical protein